MQFGGAERRAAATTLRRDDRRRAIDLGGDQRPTARSRSVVVELRRPAPTGTSPQRNRCASIESAPTPPSRPSPIGGEVVGVDVPLSGTHANASLSSRRARIIRVLTVPLGMPSSDAGFVRGQPVEHRRLHDRSQLGRQPRRAHRRDRRARHRSAPAPRPTPARPGADRAAGRAAGGADAGAAGDGGSRSPTATRRRRRCRGTLPAERHTVTNTSCTTSSTICRSAHRRASRATIHAS